MSFPGSFGAVPPTHPPTQNHVRQQNTQNALKHTGFFNAKFCLALHCTVSFLPSVADTMSQHPISAFFSTPVQPCPRAKHDDDVNTILYFRFQDRWTGKKRQEAYNVVQKACSTLILIPNLIPNQTQMVSSLMCLPQVVTHHPTQILLVPLPVQKRMTLVSPSQVSPTLIDLRQTI